MALIRRPSREKRGTTNLQPALRTGRPLGDQEGRPNVQAVSRGLLPKSAPAPNNVRNPNRDTDLLRRRPAPTTPPRAPKPEPDEKPEPGKKPELPVSPPPTQPPPQPLPIPPGRGLLPPSAPSPSIPNLPPYIRQQPIPPGGPGGDPGAAADRAISRIREILGGGVRGGRTEIETPPDPLIPQQPAFPGLVSERAAQIADAGGPLMQQAELQGRQYANSRGLLNSSLGAEAAQQAVIARASELASQDITAWKAAEENRLQQQALNLQQWSAKALHHREGTRINLEMEKFNFSRELDLERFRSDVHYRNAALNQQRDLAQQQLDLDNRRFEFSSHLDAERFRSDVEYRNAALRQQWTLSQQQVDLDAHRIGIDLARLNTDQRNQVLNGRLAANQSWQQAMIALYSNEAIPAAQKAEIARMLTAYWTSVDTDLLSLWGQQFHFDPAQNRIVQRPPAAA